VCPGQIHQCGKFASFLKVLLKGGVLCPVLFYEKWTVVLATWHMSSRPPTEPEFESRQAFRKLYIAVRLP
jgi:hypothetical protein